MKGYSWENLKEIITRSTLIFLVMIIVFMSVSFFLKSNLTQNSELIRQSNSDIIKESSIIETLSKLKSQKNQADALRGVLKNQLASKDDLIGFSREVNQLAQSSNVNVIPSFSGGADQVTGVFGSTNVSLTMSGTFSDVISFLEKLERSRYLVNITNFDLTRENENSALYRFFARGEVIYRNE